MTHLSQQPLSIGLALSGGGVRGMAHIGLIRALEELGFSISMISGTSVGAIIGAMHCNGRTVDEMLDFFRATPLFKYNYVTWHKPGLVNTDRYYKEFHKGIGTSRFEALNKPLFVMTTNMEKGELRVFHEGELIPPVLASAALPPYFSPVRIENELYADGGVMNNFPTEPLKNKVDLIFGSNVSMVRDVIRREIRSSLQLVQRTMDLMLFTMNKPKLQSCDLLFQPYALEEIGILDKKKIDDAYQIGYEHAMETLIKWKVTA